MAYYIIIAIILSLLGVISFYIDRKQAPRIRNRVEELYIYGNFAIGTVSAVTADGYGGYHAVFGDIFYRFEALGGIIYTNLGGALPKQISATTDSLFRRRLSVDINPKDKFLVLYDNNDPHNSILLLDHSIKSKTDFDCYVAKIEELRKDPNWRGFK